MVAHHSLKTVNLRVTKYKPTKKTQTQKHKSTNTNTHTKKHKQNTRGRIISRLEKTITVAPQSSSSSSNVTHRRRTNNNVVVGSRITLTAPLNITEEEEPFWQRTWFIGLLLLMALSFFGLALFLFFSLDDEVEYASAAAPPVYKPPVSQGLEITYGSALKLMHEKTRFRLHSHDVPYGSGSGQQSVTGFPNVDDANSYWIVRPVPDTSAKQGDSIKSGSIIRLQHMKTRRWLHSHLHASPISGNLEVSCFGDDGNSDTGDYWRLEIVGSGKTWRQDQRIRLLHVDTSAYLHSHDKKYSRIAGGQQEVCGVREKRADNVWLAVEGVYLPVSGSK